MDMRSLWVLAAMAVSMSAAGSGAGPSGGADPGAPATRTGALPARAQAHTAIPASPVVVPRHVYAHEAERAAKERGCHGPDGARPVAQLRAKYGVIEDYDVACATGVVRVRCDMGMCSAQR